MGGVVPLTDAHDASLYGGKAAGLARLLAMGLDVPEGCAIAFDAAPPTQVSIPAPWAVRSSAVGEDGASASFAGLHRTILEVPPDGLHQAIRDVRDSGHSDGARAYRAARGLSVEVRMGVVIQRWIRADRSYVAFGKDPVGRSDDVIIEGVPGPGEPLVSGEVNPTRFRIRSDGRIMNRDEGDDPLGAEDLEIVRIAALVRGIGARAGSPQDVELCAQGERIWVLQARPV